MLQPILSRFLLAFVLFFGMACKPKLSQAQDGDFSVGWAWSAKDVGSAKDSFWPQFRGPTGDGTAKPGANPLTTWSEKIGRAHV